MFDKRLFFIVVGLLAILYLVANKTHPDVTQALRERMIPGTAPAAATPDKDGPFDQQRQAVLATRVAESKRRAVAKYPDIAVANTEMNSRFVFRYKLMVKEGSERFKNPNWPEMLADDCAAAAGPHARPAQVVHR